MDTNFLSTWHARESLHRVTVSNSLAGLLALPLRPFHGLSLGGGHEFPVAVYRPCKSRLANSGRKLQEWQAQVSTVIGCRH